jgi:hypothetical protein
MKCSVNGCNANAVMMPRIKLGPGDVQVHRDRSVCMVHTDQVGAMFDAERQAAEAADKELCIQLVAYRAA